MTVERSRRSWIVSAVFGAALLLGHPSGLIATTIEALTFATPAQETRYRSLVAELRCLVCQNQNLADSNAELAQDLRRVTYQMIRAGRSDAEIVDFMVTRYGDFVLYRPPLTPATLFLWAGPVIFLLLGLAFAARTLRSRFRAAHRTDLEGQPRHNLRRLLDDDP